MEINTEKSIQPGIAANTLKLIAIFAMLIDHIAWAFVPLGSVLGQVMHTIGRLTIPIMCYFIAEGYYHTRNVKKYALRLGIFALISWLPVMFFETGKLQISFGNVESTAMRFPTSVIYTLFLGLISLIVWDSKKFKQHIKVVLITLICIASLLGDWALFAVLWILNFHINYGDLKKQMRAFRNIAIFIVLGPLLKFFNVLGGNWWEQIFQVGLFFAIPLLSQYNGELNGRVKFNKNFKWVFYVFYPLHLVIIGLFKYGFL